MKRNLIFKWNSINSFVSFRFISLGWWMLWIYLSIYLSLSLSLSSSFLQNFSLITFEPDQRKRLHTHPPAHHHHHYHHSFWKSENSFARWLFLLIKLCAFVIIFLNCCILFCSRHWLAKWLVHTYRRRCRRHHCRRCCQQRAVSHSANEICHLIRELN